MIYLAIGACSPKQCHEQAQFHEVDFKYSGKVFGYSYNIHATTAPGSISSQAGHY